MADISKITLPSGNTYDIKDTVARQMISGGVTFIIAWDGTSAPVVADIPAGVKVIYNNTEYIGTLTPETSGEGEGAYAQAGAFYLVKSSTSPSSETLDIYDEYVPAGETGSKFWEKIGDTKIDLSDVVTGVSLSKQTDTVIGTDATFTITQPTVALAAESSSATGRAEYVQSVSTTKISGSASGTAVTPSTTYIKGTASGANTAWNSKDAVTAVTGYPNTTSDTFVKSVSAETNKNLVTTSITPTNGTETVSKVTKTASKLATTTVPNVTSAGSASTWSFTMGTGTGNTETLIISGANSTAPTLGTAKTVATGSVDANGSGSDIITAVTISDKTVAKQGSAVTVATGATATNGTGDAVVTGVTVGDSATALTGLGSPSTKSAIGGSSTFTITQPTIALATESSSATGRVQVATGISSVTQPTITIASGSTGDVTVATGGTTKYMKATASGANTAWNSKDSVTVLKNTTDVSVTKGNS